MSSATKVIAVIAALACGCGDGSSSPDVDAGSVECFVGEEGEEPQIEVIYQTLEGKFAEAREGAKVPLVHAIQGGRILVVGARVRNMSRCSSMLSAALIDQHTDEVVSLERRPILMQETADGWLQPKDAGSVVSPNLSSLPSCPRAMLARRIDGELYRLEISVEDADGRVAKSSVEIMPTCSELDDYEGCRCECSNEYVLGQPCVSMP